VAIFGYAMGNAQAHHAVMEFAHRFFPAQTNAMKPDLLESAIGKVQEIRGTLSLVGLGSLLLTATGGFATLESAINIEWDAPSRNFIWSKVFSFLMMLVVGVLLVLSLGITSVLAWAGKIPGLQWIAQSWVVQATGYVLSILTSGVMFTAVYKLFPNTKVEWKPALVAGFATALLWELFKIGYSLYNSHVNQDATYGTLGGFVGLVLWIYYSSALVLLGSELAWVLQKRSRADG